MMMTDSPTAARTPAGRHVDLRERLEWLRLRGAGERLSLQLAREDLLRRTQGLRRAARWGMALARIVLPRVPAGGGGYALLRQVVRLAPVLLGAAGSFRRRTGRGRGGWAGLMLTIAGLGLAALRFARSRNRPDQSL